MYMFLGGTFGLTVKSERPIGDKTAQVHNQAKQWGIFSYSRGLAFCETPCYRYRKATRQRNIVDHSPSSRTVLRMSGSTPLLPLHAFTARRETTAFHNNKVDVRWFLVYLIMSTLQFMCSGNEM